MINESDCSQGPMKLPRSCIRLGESVVPGNGAGFCLSMGQLALIQKQNGDNREHAMHELMRAGCGYLCDKCSKGAEGGQVDGSSCNGAE